MLYLFHGTDHEKLRAKLASFREALHTKRPEAELFKLADEDVTPARLEELAGGQGLFERKYIVQLDRVLENADARSAVLDTLSSLADSDNVFVLVEGELDKSVLKKITKHAADVYAFETKQTTTQEFNIFSLTDALGARDKKKLWSGYIKALRAGKAPEEIHGVLFFQVKAMLLARECDNAADAGMKQFPFQKAKRYAGNFSEDELTALSRSLITTYHNARRGEGDLEENLEQWVVRV